MGGRGAGIGNTNTIVYSPLNITPASGGYEGKWTKSMLNALEKFKQEIYHQAADIVDMEIRNGITSEAIKSIESISGYGGRASDLEITKFFKEESGSDKWHGQVEKNYRVVTAMYNQVAKEFNRSYDFAVKDGGNAQRILRYRTAARMANNYAHDFSNHVLKDWIEIN